MACRVGMTTKLAERKEYWQSQHSTLHNWQTFGPFSTREDAQAKEDSLARQFGCQSSPGGADSDDPNAQWSVYKFDY